MLDVAGKDALTTRATNTVDAVMSQMLAPTGLDQNDLENALGSLYRRDVDTADLYFQVSRRETWMLEDVILKEGSFNHDQGVGVRAVCGDKTGLAYSEELVLPALENATLAARAISRQGQSKSVRVPSRGVFQSLYPATDPTSSICLLYTSDAADE